MINVNNISRCLQYLEMVWILVFLWFLLGTHSEVLLIALWFSKTLDPYIVFPAGPLTWCPAGNSNWKGGGNLSSSTPSPLPTPSLSPWMHHPSHKPQILPHPLRYCPWHSSSESPLLSFHSCSLSWVSPRQTLVIICRPFCLIWPPAHQSILHPAPQRLHVLTMLTPFHD